MTNYYPLIPIVIGTLFVFAGRGIMSLELADAQCADIDKKIKTWEISAAAITILLTVICFKYAKSLQIYDVLIFSLITLYSLFIGLVDLYTHNMYLETAAMFIIYIIGGWSIHGLKYMLLGALCGIVTVAFIIAFEWILRRNISLGGADILYIIFGCALVGFTHIELYLACIAVCSSVTGITAIIVGKITKKEICRFTTIPILGMLGCATIIVYAAALLEARTGYPTISGLCLYLCNR